MVQRNIPQMGETDGGGGGFCLTLGPRRWHPAAMAEPPVLTPDDSAPDISVIHPLRPLALAGALTWAMFLIAAVAVYWLCAPYVPTGRLNAWAALSAVFIAIWAGILVTMAVRKPKPEELVRVWGRAARFLIYGSHTIVVLAIWFFLPLCPVELQRSLALFFLFNSPMQMIATPESVAANRVGVVMTNGSLILWFALFGGVGGEPYILFSAMLGVALLLLSNVIPRTVHAVVRERIQSDETARLLSDALRQVAAERDAKTRFIATASHDLGQPLQAANLFFDQTMRAPNEASRNHAAEGVKRAFAAADQLLGHMLNHLRLEADRVEPIASRVHLGQLIERVTAQYSLAANAAGLRIRIVDTSRLLLLDPVLLERALGNLVANAIHHSGATRLLIGVRGRGADNLRIWVIDDGVGIGRADAAHIFDDYYRGTDSKALVKSGFGLGLSSVRRIAALMRGSAGLESRWIRGAAFYLDFPDAKLPRRTGPAPKRAAERRRITA